MPLPEYLPAQRCLFGPTSTYRRHLYAIIPPELSNRVTAELLPFKELDRFVFALSLHTDFKPANNWPPLEKGVP